MLTKNRRDLSVFLIFMACLLSGIDSFATKRYWVGNNSNKNWNSTGNWSATSGGTSGASVPVSTDSVYFDGSGTGQCSINATVSIKRLEITSGYTDTLKQNTFAITVGTGGMVLSGGVFKGGSAAITDDGIFTLSGTNFISTSATLSITGNYSFTSGTFTHNNGTVLFDTSCSITGSTTFYRLTLSTAGATVIYNINAATTLTCTNLFRTDGTNPLTINNGSISAQGDITANNGHSSISTGGSATITINGTGSQLFTGRTTAGFGKLCNVTINKASGMLTLKDHISVNGDWKYLQGTLDITTYASVVMFFNTSGAHRISGKHTLGSVSFEFTAASNALIIPVGDTLIITGTMKVEGSLNGRLDSGVVNAKGDITLAHTHAGAAINVNTLITGTGSQVFTGGATIGQSKTGTVKINKPSGTLTLKNVITVGGHWNYTAGTIDGSTNNSTVAFAPGTRNVTGSHSLYNVSVYASGGASVNNMGSGDSLTVLGELKLEGSSNATINTGTLNVKGDITITNTSTSNGAGSAVFNICGTGSQTFTGSGVSNGGQIGHVKVNKPSGTLYLASLITVGAANWDYYAGTVSEGTSNVAFSGTGMVSCKNGPASMAFYNAVILNGTRTMSSVLKVRGYLAISSGKVLNADSNEVHLAGNWNNSGTFTYAGSTVVFNGTGPQYISKSSGTETFYILEVKKNAGKVYLNNPVVPVEELLLTKGVLVTTPVNYINIPNNAKCDPGSDSSYVCGPVRKTGDDVFVFPLGDTVLVSGAYHPLSITSPSDSTDVFTGRYYAVNQPYGTTLETDSLESISDCEYWLLTRNAGSSVVIPSVGWNKNSCNVYDQYDICIAGWDGTKWNSFGKQSATYGTQSGTLNGLRGLSLTAFPITIGSPIVKFATSECVLKKKLDAGYYKLRNGMLKFKFDEEYVKNGDELDFKIYDKDRSVIMSSALSSITLNVVYKDNRWALNLLAIMPSMPSGYYILEVKDKKGEISMLRFKI